MSSKQSVVREAFEFPVDGIPSQTFKAKCKTCGSFISGSLKATSNFLTHLQRRHAHVLTGLKDKKGKLTDEQPSLDTFVETEQKKFSSSDSRQQKITDSLTMFIDRSLMPLSIVENSYFRDLLHCMEPRFVIPSRKHLTSSLITKKCEEIILAMKQDFEKTESVCVTIDLWSSRQMRGFIGITGHYISYWHLESVTHGCKQFTGRHTAENILQHYEETIATFNLSSKITNIVTDNASNMKKAFRVDLPGFVEGSRDERDQEEDESDSEEESMSEDKVDTSNAYDYIPEHQSCFAHTL
ncbi:E3 SUMO-protein ligase ZBED1-like [Haliotis rubra]|uniref:E3 SUMO-protein ligase ZBED1-like n=1 Tax=Haliotis rubra TaxID=36100 RepID=UPI001EE51019|nr:E3 SUMO-protein ligase ZBED1-like [Haliotis rubra]